MRDIIAIVQSSISFYNILDDIYICAKINYNNISYEL